MFLVSLFRPRLLALPAIAAMLLPAARADQIVMKDGDRITGQIVKKDGDDVVVQSKNFGTLTLHWSDVASITTDQALTVELSGGQTVTANLQPQDGRIEVAAPGGARTVDPSDIVALRNEAEQASYERLLHPGPFDLWTITGSLNIAGTKGNAETSTLTTPINFERNSSTSQTKAYFNSIRSKASVDGVSSPTARAVRGGWSFSRNLTRRKVLANAFNDYEYDAFQSLDLRVVLGGGLGYQVWTGESGRLAAVAGGAWNREKFSPTESPAFTRNSAEVYYGDDFNYKLNARTNAVQSFRTFHNLTTVGEYRINFDIGATTDLTSWLTWNISLSDRFLSMPVAGRKSNDFLYSTGLGFKFTR